MQYFMWTLKSQDFMLLKSWMPEFRGISFMVKKELKDASDCIILSCADVNLVPDVQICALITIFISEVGETRDGNFT